MQESKLKSGVELIAEERKRQIEVERFDDDSWRINDDLAIAASHYACPYYLREMKDFFGDPIPKTWPFKSKWWKPTPDNRIKELVKAGALIAAELDRLLKIEELHQQP